MNEIENFVKKQTVDISIVIILMAVLMCAVAPLFKSWIKIELCKKYAMESNYEELANKELTNIMPLLWVVAAITWIIIILTHLL